MNTMTFSQGLRCAEMASIRRTPMASACLVAGDEASAPSHHSRRLTHQQHAAHSDRSDQ